MTLTFAYWLYDKMQDQRKTHTKTGSFGHVVGSVAYTPIAVGISLMPYHTIGKTMNWLDAFNRSAHAQQVARSQYNYMVKHGMKISKSSHAHFAQQGVARQRFFTTFNMRTARGVLTKGKYLRFAGKMGARLVPGLGMALLAYDVYTVTNMILD